MIVKETSNINIIILLNILYFTVYSKVVKFTYGNNTLSINRTINFKEK